MPVVRVNPDADVHFVPLELAEHHADLLARINRDEPGGLFVVEAPQRVPDLVVQIAGRPPGSVAGGAHFLFAQRPLDVDEAAAALLTGEALEMLAFAHAKLAALAEWDTPALEAAIREVEEESGLRVRLLGLCGVIDRVVREQDAVRYHYVIVDYVAECVGGRLEAGSDAAEVRWVAVSELAQYETTDGLVDMIEKALAIRRAMSAQPGGPNR